MLITLPQHAQASGGAFAVDDSGVGNPGECKVESFGSFATDGSKDVTLVTSPACVVNVGRPVEVGVAVQRARADGEWSTAGSLKAKTNIIPAGMGTIGVAISGALNYDFTSKEYTGSAINIPVSFVITDTFRIDVNAGWLHDAVANLDYLTWGAGFEWNLAKQLTFIAEVFGQAGTVPEDTPSSLTDPRVQAGLRFTPHEKFDIDVIYGRNIAGGDANWITLGLNVRFP